MLGGCWFTTLGKDSRHTWRLLVYYLGKDSRTAWRLLVYYLGKDSRHAWRLLVYCLREGFKARLEAASLLP